MSDEAPLPERPARRYLRPPAPLYFPSEAEVPEGPIHLRLRTALFLVLEGRLKGRAYIGSDQFVYWDPTNPKACLAPDALVRMGGPLTLPENYKIWEHGAPHLAVEVMSRSEVIVDDVPAKLQSYRHTGIEEIVFFDWRRQDPPLRIWDAEEGELFERNLSDPAGRFCKTLAAYWCVQPDAELGVSLRLADDPEGTKLWLTPAEAAAAAEARVRELEAELARRG